MVQIQTFFFFIIFVVVLCGTAAPVLLKWFVSRDVSTGASFFNGTLIPIFIALFVFLVYLHSRQFLRSMDRVKRGVLVQGRIPVLLSDIRGRSSSETRARKILFCFVPVVHCFVLESTGNLPYLGSFCGVLCLLFFCTLFCISCDSSAKREGACRRDFGHAQVRKDKILFSRRSDLERRGEDIVPLSLCVAPSWDSASMGSSVLAEKVLEARALPTSRELMTVGDTYSQKVRMTLSHGGVCIFMLGVLLSSTNTKKIQFTQRLPLGSELHMGKELCCLRGLDHLYGPTFHAICGNLMIYKPAVTKDRLIVEHAQSLRDKLLPIDFVARYAKGKLDNFLLRWIKNRENNNVWLSMFPEKRYFRETTSTTEVAIHTNLFTDLYASIGTGSSRTGGWYTTIMKMPFIFFIWIGFLFASLGGYSSLVRQLKKDKLHWN